MATENYATEIAQHVDTLFDGLTGYVYAPTLSPTGYWQTYFFAWPRNRNAIITHLLTQSKENNVYVAPSLFKAHSAKQQAWKGTNFVWCEFDGNAPQNDLPAGVPDPTIKIQSSESGHEHWYWKLDNFESNPETVEGITRNLTYALDADKSGWDVNQVLRPIGTIHHDSGKRVRLINKDSARTYSLGDFKSVVLAPAKDLVIKELLAIEPSATVASRYSWDDDAWDLFNKPTQEQGKRSSAMTRLGFDCVEMGMSNEETFSILLDADDRWGKYKYRPIEDRHKRLMGIIIHCRSQAQLKIELSLSDRETFVSLKDFRTLDIKVRWLFKNFLTEKGLGVISSAPGVGKSTVSLNMCFATALGRDFLNFEYIGKKPVRSAFLSFEMSGTELKVVLDSALGGESVADQELLDENLFIFPLGYSLSLDRKEQQQLICDEVDKHGIEFLVIDSLKAVTKLDEKRMDTFFDWVNKELRERRGITVWIIHHNRKPPNETGVSKRPSDLGDLYGDTFISSHPTAVITLYRKTPTDKYIEVIPLKVRLAEVPPAFHIRRGPHSRFVVTELPKETVTVKKTTIKEAFKQHVTGEDNTFG